MAQTTRRACARCSHDDVCSSGLLLLWRRRRRRRSLHVVRVRPCLPCARACVCVFIPLANISVLYSRMCAESLLTIIGENIIPNICAYCMLLLPLLLREHVFGVLCTNHRENPPDCPGLLQCQARAKCLPPTIKRRQVCFSSVHTFPPSAPSPPSRYSLRANRVHQ